MANRNNYGANLQRKCQKSLDNILEIYNTIEKKLAILEEKKRKWKECEKKAEENAKKAKQKIKLDVGGKIFTTSKSTLLRYENTYFYGMLGSGKWKPDEDGIIFPF
jgi:hypothetical protein